MIQVIYDQRTYCTEGTYDDITQAEEGIILAFVTEDIRPESIVEVNEEGQEVCKFSCDLSVKTVLVSAKLQEIKTN